MENFFEGLSGRWPQGREDYCWHVLPGDGQCGDRLAAQYRELMTWPGLAPVSAKWMHLTLQHLAPASEVSGTRLGRMIRQVRGRCGGIAPFTATVGRAEMWETSVVCPVQPASVLCHLRLVIADVGREVGIGRFDADDSPFFPHLTLAYALTRVDQEPMRACPADCGAEEAMPVSG